ncbi:MAG: ROK family protein [bacterium]
MYFIGIDLGGTNLRGGAVTMDGHITHSAIKPTHAQQGVEHVIHNLKACIDELIASQNPSPLLGIGIGCPGIIEIKSGVIHTSPNLPGWNDVPLKQIIEEHFRVPVYIENDANTIAYGEKWYGAGRTVSSLICLTLGTGVGGGIILDGKIWHGCMGMAGEVGHMTIIYDGITCNCGNRGCLEAYASASALVKRTLELLNEGHKSTLSHICGKGEEVTAEIIYKAAKENDALSRRILHDIGIYLGIGIATLINLLNPEMIVIGGGMSHSWDMFYPSMVEEIRKRAFDIPVKSAQIVRAQLGDNAGIIGAVALISHALPT